MCDAMTDSIITAKIDKPVCNYYGNGAQFTVIFW
jgi:hypothetical protein